jgi:hypothetical protein
MAGGMNKRGAWGPMADRVNGAEGGAPPAPAVKHCWVTDQHGRLPALLLEWRRTEAGFQGRVVRPVADPEGGWVVVVEWLPAAWLAPA